LILALALGGCVTARKMAAVRAIPVGMNELQVAAIVGQPKLKDRTEEGLERWLWVRRTQFGTESAFLIFRDGHVVSRGSEEERDGQVWKEPIEEASTNATAISAIEERVKAAAQRNGTNVIAATVPTNAVMQAAPELNKHEDIGREQPSLPAASQRETRQIEEKVANPRLEVPPLTAWYMARQYVSEDLAPKRTIFPNPRFATGVAGEERVVGNVWRAWGYVDTVDATNAPKRLHWTAELEYLGGTKWRRLKKITFEEK
jgi:hypothetical protein